MAFAREVYTAVGTDPEDFTITYPYILDEHVKVFVNGVEQIQDVDYAFNGATTIRFSSATSVLTGGDVVVLTRDTSQDAPLVDWSVPGILSEEDLDENTLQSLYIGQEAIDRAGLTIGLDATNVWDALLIRIGNVADPVNDQDAVTKAYGDANYGGQAADDAAASAAAAAGSASAASTSESNAAISASGAATSETNAAASEVAAEAALDEFTDLYLGAKATDPTLDNDGDPLQTGALYFNTTNDIMRVYNGTAWQNINAGIVAADIDSESANNGDVLTADGAGGSSFQPAGGGGGLQSVQTITATGTWTKPAGVNLVVVEMQAAGGAGGGLNASPEAGGGGGAGEYVKFILDVSSIASSNITIGAGGTGVNNGTGNSGGNTVWNDGVNTFTANGGAGGSPSSGAGQPGGAGGSGGSAGVLNIPGQDGHPGFNSNPHMAGAGGDAVLGHGGKFSVTQINPPPVPGGYGGGGEGAFRDTGSGNRVGGTGAQGVMIVWEYA